MKSYYVYILASITRCLYTGITNDLERRLVKHRSGHGSGFARRYRIQRLVYVEVFTNVREAIAREKQIKRWRRATKVRLIEAMNPAWKDLHPEWSGHVGPADRGLVGRCMLSRRSVVVQIPRLRSG